MPPNVVTRVAYANLWCKPQVTVAIGTAPDEIMRTAGVRLT